MKASIKAIALTALIIPLLMGFDLPPKSDAYWYRDVALKPIGKAYRDKHLALVHKVSQSPDDQALTAALGEALNRPEAIGLGMVIADRACNGDKGLTTAIKSIWDTRIENDEFFGLGFTPLMPLLWRKNCHQQIVLMPRRLTQLLPVFNLSELILLQYPATKKVSAFYQFADEPSEAITVLFGGLDESIFVHGGNDKKAAQIDELYAHALLLSSRDEAYLEFGRPAIDYREDYARRVALAAINSVTFELETIVRTGIDRLALYLLGNRDILMSSGAFPSKIKIHQSHVIDVLQSVHGQNPVLLELLNCLKKTEGQQAGDLSECIKATIEPRFEGSLKNHIEPFFLENLLKYRTGTRVGLFY